MMTTYDDKTEGIVASGRQFVMPVCKECDDVTFKASYIVLSNLRCNGKITALFDLIVLGNVEANEIDVKGRFVCLGNCAVIGSIIVQNEIWANDLRASSIEARDRIIAHEIDGDIIIADGSIIVGKTLAVEKLVKSGKNILCGETAYGAGRVAAKIIITGEPLDLDDGEEAVESPYLYQSIATQPQSTQGDVAPTVVDDLISYGESEYAQSGEFTGYLDYLTSMIFDSESKAKFFRWKEVLSEAVAARQSGIGGYLNIAIIIWLAEIAYSDYFKNWAAVDDVFDAFETHFKG